MSDAGWCGHRACTACQIIHHCCPCAQAPAGLTPCGVSPASSRIGTRPHCCQGPVPTPVHVGTHRMESTLNSCAGTASCSSRSSHGCHTLALTLLPPVSGTGLALIRASPRLGAAGALWPLRFGSAGGEPGCKALTHLWCPQPCWNNDNWALVSCPRRSEYLIA